MSDTVYYRCIVTIEYKYEVGVTFSEFEYTNKLQRFLAELTLGRHFWLKITHNDIGNGAR